jgi:hypothetical protein
LATQSGVRFREEDAVLAHAGFAGQENDARVALVRRVLESSTFEHSPKLRSFLEYVCRCALNDEPAAATESQIGIHVFGRPPGYNANEDNIVRSQARLLRLKLEHHFANEGRTEPVVITIPKGRYLPAFEPRLDAFAVPETKAAVQPDEPSPDAPRAESYHRIAEAPEEIQDRRESSSSWRWALVAIGAVVALAIVWFARTSAAPRLAAAGTPVNAGANVGSASTYRPSIAVPIPDKTIRIASGDITGSFSDLTGERWSRDVFFEGGAAKSGPERLFPPVADPSLFRNIREGVSVGIHPPSGFQYDIPAPPGVYELRLYFADPLRYTVAGADGQHLRHFQVNLNGKPILIDFDAVADAGQSAVDIRAFKDVSPAQDGEIHLDFVPSPDRPFVSALELSPGVPGAMQPIRISVHNTDLVDDNGIRWSGDRYFVDGSKVGTPLSPGKPPVSPVYTQERYGNFSYAIPVPPGSYTVRLHFMESFWGPSSGICTGIGCRIFDVTCNGETLLQDFDVFKAAGGDYRPAIKTFHGLRPNGQGKLLISFSPRVDYAEVRAIEVLDENRGEPANP